jgi:hypothetical protein
VVDVARRFGLTPAAVLAWNAVQFYAVVDCLCNVAHEEEAEAEEVRRRWRKTPTR